MLFKHTVDLVELGVIVEYLAFWQISMLGLVVIFGLIAIAVLVRAMPRREPVSAEERAEMATAPMSASEKGAWLGLLIGVATLAGLATLLTARGVVEYWENDDFRLLVLAIFIVGIVAHAVVANLFTIKSVFDKSIDERESAIVSRASIVQPPAILITFAVWMITLAERFHDEGAVPVVYLYLMFGSIILVLMISQSAGVLLGHWIGRRHG